MTPSRQGTQQLIVMGSSYQGPATATISGIAASIDGDDYDYRLYSERDEDNLTHKNSEHDLRQGRRGTTTSSLYQELVNAKRDSSSFISSSLNQKREQEIQGTSTQSENSRSIKAPKGIRKNSHEEECLRSDQDSSKHAKA